jgi:hypothetical protein
MSSNSPCMSSSVTDVSLTLAYIIAVHTRKYYVPHLFREYICEYLDKYICEYLLYVIYIHIYNIVPRCGFY